MLHIVKNSNIAIIPILDMCTDCDYFNKNPRPENKNGIGCIGCYQFIHTKYQ